MKQGPKGAGRERALVASEALDYLDHLYRVAIHLAKEQQVAHDLVQETYARALDSYAQFTPGTNMKAWLTRILYNFFLDDYHRRRRWVLTEPKVVLDNESADFWEQLSTRDPGPEDRFLHKELSVKIEEALEKIPEEFRTAIVLVDLGELSYAEAAEILCCPLGTVRSRLSRGRRYLVQHLKGYMRLD